MFLRLRSVSWLCALLPGLIPLAAAQSALGDIYKWTDAQGNTNFSNLPPAKSEKARNVMVVAKESGPSAIPARTAAPTEQELMARIENLEHQLQARQSAALAPPGAPPAASHAPPPPAPYAGYYPVAPPAQLQYYYDNSNDSGYYPAYAPNYYYPVLPWYAYGAYPRRAFFARPGFNTGFRGSFHGGGGHGGRR